MNSRRHQLVSRFGTGANSIPVARAKAPSAGFGPPKGDENGNGIPLLPKSCFEEELRKTAKPIKAPKLTTPPKKILTFETKPKNPPPAPSKKTAEEELLMLNPEAEITVELPTLGNGNKFQARTKVIDSNEVFIGRGETRAQAVDKCCAKAVRFIRTYWDQREGRVMPLHERRLKTPPKKKADAELDAYFSKFAPAKKEEEDKKTAEEDTFILPSVVVTADDREDEYYEFIGGPCAELRQRAKPNVPIKNAVMMLNELFPPPAAPQYKVTSQTGPPNNPTFTMVCTVEDRCFHGEGKSKKEAKLSCSQKAVEVLYGYTQAETKSVPERSNPRANADLDDWMELEGKNPVSILNELYPGIQYALLSTTGPSHAPNFVIKASLDDMSFEGSGKSKKDAKLNASKALLVHLHKVGFDPMTGTMMRTEDATSSKAVADGHSFADQIGQLVTAKYQSLFGTTTYSKRRVMAGIAMSQKDDEMRVICVSSGTKCVNGEQLSLEGCVINDSHAEIVARRCLVAFFYAQLERAISKEATEEDEEDAFILERCPDDSEMFRVKAGVEFHLFVTTSPCGDARIFSLHEGSGNGTKKKEDEDEFASPSASTASLNKNLPSDSSRGMLRSKIECGMGTVPINPRITIQTWDGVMSGDRLLTMACSDKILRWNVLGLQGALLTHVMRPVYLSSVTVGSKFHPGHMKRALYERVESQSELESLPPDFRLNRPDMFATTSPETRQATKAHDYSVNWIEDQGQPEIVNASTGKTINDNVSRLSKRSLFARFVGLRRLKTPLQYAEAKRLAFDYQEAKKRLMAALDAEGCGRWIEKPVEQDQFSSV